MNAHLPCLILCLFVILGPFATWLAITLCLAARRGDKMMFGAPTIAPIRSSSETHSGAATHNRLTPGFLFLIGSWLKHFPITERKALAVPGCSETLSAPKGLGSGVNKPLMRKPRGPLFWARADRDTAGNTFRSECTPELGRILKHQITCALAADKSSPERTK